MCSVKHSRQVNAYHDGELPPEEARRFEAHLAECPICAEELRQLRSLSRLLKGAPAPDAPAKVIRRLHGTVATGREAAIVLLAERLIAAAAAILILCMVWTWGVLGRTGTTAAPNSWEWTAVAPHAETPGDTQQLAQWIVEDLSSERAHD